MNSVSITGRITKDPELRVTPSGTSVCAFSVAVDRPNVKDKVDFLDCVAWRASAEFVSKYFHKGDGIEITGCITSRTSENQNPPLQYVVYSSTTTETAFQDDRPAGYRTYIYLNLWSDIDPTDMANRIRQAMYDADFWMLEESDKGYNQPAYDPATRTYTVQWTWVYWQEAL